MTTIRRVLLAAVIGLGVGAPASAQTLIEEWGTAQFPPPPALKAAKLEPRETAVLVMDFTKQTCTAERRKRCADQVPKVLRFVTEARGKGALIIYSVAVPNSVPADILPELKPASARFSSEKASSPFSCSQRAPDSGSKSIPKPLRNP